MTKITAGQQAFEAFCNGHRLSWIHVRKLVGEHTPDYQIDFSGIVVYFEIKDITEDDTLGMSGGSRKVGDHVRAKIEKARAQAQSVARRGFPAVLLVYNALDPVWQAFGTEDHDFITAMYGELTVVVSKKTNRITDSFLGKNRLLQERKNTSFSGVGGFRNRAKSVFIYENVFAKNKLPFPVIPAFIDVRPVEIEGAVR